MIEPGVRNTLGTRDAVCSSFEGCRRVLDRLKEKGFEIRVLSHAEAILEQDFPAALEEIEDALVDVVVPVTEIIGSGGGETKGTQRMRKAFADLGWRKTNFEIKKIVNGVEKKISMA